MDVHMYIKYVKAKAEAKRWKNKYLMINQYGKKLPGDSELVARLTDLANDFTSRHEDTAVLDAAIRKLRSMEWKTGNPDKPGRYLVSIRYPMATKDVVDVLKWLETDVWDNGKEKTVMCWNKFDTDYGYYPISDGRVSGWLPLPDPHEEGADE